MIRTTEGVPIGTPFLYFLTMPAAGSCLAKGCVFVKNNHMRVMLCLLMCCALLFTCVARPASATSVEVVAGLAAIPVAVAVACTFQALGYMSAANSTSFTNTVNRASSWFSEKSDWVVNGAVTLLGLTSETGTISYLPHSFIQDIWQWLFDTQTVTSSFVSDLSYTSWNNNQYHFYSADTFSPITVRYDFGSTYAYYSYLVNGDSFTVNRSTNGASPTTLSPTFYSAWNCYAVTVSNTTDLSRVSSSFPIVGTVIIPDGGQIADYRFEGISIPNYVSSSGVLGQIQSPYLNVGTEEEIIQIEIAPIYIDWTKYGVPDPHDPGGDDPDNDGKFPMWFPTGIPSPGYDDSVITQNQQQAQSGVVSGDITFEPYEPEDPGAGGGGAGSGTDLSSVIQTIINVPTAIVSGIRNFISDFFGFNGNHEDCVVQLRDFFPFCIPFDLYDFITVLSAEPEAPVFHWEIPVPQLGQTFELEVDLSAWDDIAVLFRNLELLAFIFGLAIMTREKFLRS